MKSTILILALLSPLAFAQTVNVKDIDAGQEGSTTIKIEKNKPDDIKKSEVQWEVTDGQADLEGDSGATNKDAKANWKTACNDWKKEIRQDNKDSKVLSINCGSVTCSGDAGNKVCSSKATYKIKTRLN